MEGQGGKKDEKREGKGNKWMARDDRGKGRVVEKET